LSDLRITLSWRPDQQQILQRLPANRIHESELKSVAHRAFFAVVLFVAGESGFVDQSIAEIF
jgi:hypothetical protein